MELRVQILLSYGFYLELEKDSRLISCKSMFRNRNGIALPMTCNGDSS